MPELGYRPVNKYLPPRPGRMAPCPPSEAGRGGAAALAVSATDKLLRWVDRLLSR